MGKTIVVLGLAALVATGAGAQGRQQSWQGEIGIQGGFSRFKPAGTAAKDYVDLFDVPGFSLSPLNHSYGALFAIIPWRDKIALEPTLSTSQLSAGGLSFSLVTLGVRADYALTPQIYAAAGGTLGYLEALGQHESQLGLQAALGYRLRLSGGLNGRVEANWQSTKNSELLGPANLYSVLFGVAARTGGGASRATRPMSAWDPVVGAQGGYSHIHAVGAGGGDIAVLSFPGWGTGLTATPLIPGNVIAVAPTMFAIFPVGQKLALEPGIDFHRTQSQGVTVFSANLSARLAYAVHGGWYAAAGGNLVYTKATKGYFSDSTRESVSVPGVNVAWGYRFHLAGSLGGRVEANYVMLQHNSDLDQATNTFGLMLGATMPLR